MEKTGGSQLALNPNSVLVVAADVPRNGGFERRVFYCRAAELAAGRLRPSEDGVFDALESDPSAKVHLVLYPTRTYSEGLGGGLASFAPEDLRLARRLERRYPGRVERHRVAPPEAQASNGSSWIEFKPEFLRSVGEIFKSCMTHPNRQDYLWLATKTFGLNLAIRLAFVFKGVSSGQLPVFRAACSTSWYQLQDAVFTVFGQTYMKFLGKMTGMVRVGRAYLGDFVFVYVQLCGFEFLNRLVLGPLGENPLVYTGKGLGLIAVNILQGMLSGGPLVPAINKLRKAGYISHATMMHLYQLTSLTMHFGLFATFGYQRFYAFLTGAVLVLSWSSYIWASAGAGEGRFDDGMGSELVERLDETLAAALRT